VEKVMANAYELVLMDLQMPELDGYDATRKIRSLPEERFRRLPIIALTASSRIGMEDRLEHAGFTDFVGKPFKLEELFAKIARHASRSMPLQRRRHPVREQAQEVSGSATPSRSFNLDGFRKVTEGDPEGLVELLSITLTRCEHYKQEFQDALEAGNLKQFEFHTHKIKMTLELLKAQGLRAALKEGKALLSEPKGDPARLQSLGQRIQRELDAIIDVLKMELGKG
jgi:CheY-like chemotaxis protein/HPt (histidine-containing phosphotransfer) domain-containing protein